jgi:hypothetical protein
MDWKPGRWFEKQDHGLETRTLVWKTGSWIRNQDAVFGNRIMD